MKTTPISIAPQQPGLRAFVVYDEPPRGWLPFVVTDNETAPLLRPGDVILVDTSSRKPIEGELFLRRYATGTMGIVETWSRVGCFGCGPDDGFIDTRCWFTGPYDRARASGEVRERLERGGAVGWCDGPFATEGSRAGILETKLVGRVVGILHPSFEEPRRIAV